MPGHPAGLLAIAHTTTCSAYEADSQTRAADRERVDAAFGEFTRPATTTERRLLAALGHVPPPELSTHVTRSGGTDTRTWPAIETAESPKGTG